MQNYDDEYVKHKKKSSAKPPQKSKHKHRYEDCLFAQPTSRYDKAHGIVYDNYELVFGSYCPVCGKIGSVNIKKWYDLVKSQYDGPSIFLQCMYSEEPNEAAKCELDPETRTLPLFTLTEMFGQKYVDLEEHGNK